MRNGVQQVGNGVLVADCSQTFSIRSPCVVVPFIDASDLKGAQPGRLAPVFEVEGRSMALLPLQIAAVALRELSRQPVRMLTDAEAYAVSGALGVLFEGV